MPVTRLPPPSFPVQIFRDTQYLNSLSGISVFGSFCYGHASPLLSLYTPLHFPGSGAARDGGGLGGVAAW